MLSLNTNFNIHLCQDLSGKKCQLVPKKLHKIIVLSWSMMDCIQFDFFKFVRTTNTNPYMEETVSATEHGRNESDEVVDTVPVFGILFQAKNDLKSALVCRIVFQLAQVIGASLTFKSDVYQASMDAQRLILRHAQYVGRDLLQQLPRGHNVALTTMNRKCLTETFRDHSEERIPAFPVQLFFKRTITQVRLTLRQHTQEMSQTNTCTIVSL